MLHHTKTNIENSVITFIHTRHYVPNVTITDIHTTLKCPQPSDVKRTATAAASYVRTGQNTIQVKPYLEWKAGEWMIHVHMHRLFVQCRNPRWLDGFAYDYLEAVKNALRIIPAKTRHNIETTTIAAVECGGMLNCIEC